MLFRSFEVEDPEVTRPILSKKRSNPMDGYTQQVLTFRSAIVIVAIGLCLVVGGWMLKKNQNGDAISMKIAMKAASDVSSDSSDSADTPSEGTGLDTYVYKNMHYLGMGYNLYEGNPWTPTTGSGSNTTDPGFTRPIADIMRPSMVTSEYRTQWNSEFKAPRGVTIFPDMNNCTNTIVFALEANGKNPDKSLFTRLGSMIHVNGGYMGDLLNGAFTGSAQYKTQVDDIIAHNRTYVMAGKGCLVYKALWGDFSGSHSTIPYLDEKFKNTVQYHLPTIVDPTDADDPYRQLIREYGTHYTYGVAMGSLYMRASVFSGESIQEMRASGMDIVETAKSEYSAWRQQEGSPGSETALQQEDVQKFKQLRMDEFHVRRGPISNDSTWAWKSSMEPYPVYIRLDLLSNLLVESQFPDCLCDLAIKNTNLLNTILHLCSQPNATCSTTPRLGDGGGGGEEEGGAEDGTGKWIVNG